MVQYVGRDESYEGQAAMALGTYKCMVALSAEAVYPLKAEELPFRMPSRILAGIRRWHRQGFEDWVHVFFLTDFRDSPWP
jgi:hypothetical protein